MALDRAAGASCHARGGRRPARRRRARGNPLAQRRQNLGHLGWQARPDQGTERFLSGQLRVLETALDALTAPLLDLELGEVVQVLH
ncbi:MAG: hypothetical protein HY698_14580 [Deltaproteobacteria bacterium]|nr:hypothetical protein [Deltaproteobacteria bacterium]